MDRHPLGARFPQPGHHHWVRPHPKHGLGMAIHADRGVLVRGGIGLVGLELGALTNK